LQAQAILDKGYRSVSPTFSIITPSYGQLEWLRLAAASVADQEGGNLEHIVQDACTGTELESWASGRPGLKLYVEKDSGMYDAINRGLRRASGEICGYLNCDEQYLPGALANVARDFEQDPKIDILLAGSIVVDESGRYISSRPALRPFLNELKAGRMYNLSCSMFFRRRLFSDQGILFDPALRIIGDLQWLKHAIASGARVNTANYFTSVFSDLGTNLALSASANKEAANLFGGAFHRISLPAFVMFHRLRRLLAGHYFPQPFGYSIYTLESPDKRQTFKVERPTGVWRNRL
jgi:glycosyltransferase involved in cell wall biosynthesis